MDNCTCKTIVQEKCLDLAKTLESHCFPERGVAGMFGCEIDNAKDVVLVEAPPMHGMKSESMKLERAVYGAWKTLLLNALFREAAIVDAICAGQLPEWYEKEVRNGGPHLSYYAKALADGDYFKDIQWDRQLLAQPQFTSKSKSHCFRIGQDVEVHSLKGEAGEKYNGRIAQVLNTTHPSIKEKLVVVVAGRKLGVRPDNLRDANQCRAAGLKQNLKLDVSEVQMFVEAQAHGSAKVEEDISSSARCTSLQANTVACSTCSALNSKACTLVQSAPSAKPGCSSGGDEPGPV